MKTRYTIIFSNYDDLANPYYAGGGARAVHEVARRLARKHDVTVLTGNYPGARDEIVDGVSYHRIGTLFSGSRLGQLSFFTALPYHTFTRRFDVWIESFTPPFSTACLQWFTSRPVIGLVHMLSGVDMKRKYKLPFDMVERWGLRTYRKFIVLTQASCDRIRRVNKEAEIAVIPNGIERGRGQVRVERRHILFLGRIEIDQKGLDILVRAYDRIASEAGCPLVIAGSGTAKEEAELRRLVSACSLPQNIQWVGKVEGERKLQLLREARCLVVPSRFETFSLVALEAMSVGTPVIAFALSGLEWMPGRAVVKIEPFDEVALARAMFLAARKKSDEIATSLPEAFWDRYDWDRVARRYETSLLRTIAEYQSADLRSTVIAEK